MAYFLTGTVYLFYLCEKTKKRKPDAVVPKNDKQATPYNYGLNSTKPVFIKRLGSSS